MNVPAGTDSHEGYRYISINGDSFPAHRLAFFYMEGQWPPEYVDHKDGNPGNNKWDNLRHASAQQNAQNKRRKYNSFTGIKGVVKNFASDTWDIHMRDGDGNVVSEGPFFSYQKACKRYDELAAQFFGEFAKKEVTRIQRATFNNKEVQAAVEEFIKGKVLINGRYQSPKDSTQQ